MTWVPPFFVCGSCGGEIGRWPMTNMLRQEVLDWRHRTVPDGTEPHRAVLGTPGPRTAVATAKSPAPVVATAPIPPPEVPARYALAGDLPGGATAIVNAAERNEWAVKAYFMRGPWLDAGGKVSRTASSVVLHCDRDGHRLVAAWSTDTQDAWKFEDAWSLTHYQTPIGSPELRELLKAPRAICEDCQEPPALHISTPTGPVCHAELNPPTT